MISTFGKAFKTPDLRKKILFTLGIMALFRFGSVIPTPGVSYKNVQTCIDQVQNNGLFALVNMFSGGALLHLSVFALGIIDRKSTRLNSSHMSESRMPSSA